MSQCSSSTVAIPTRKETGCETNRCRTRKRNGNKQKKQESKQETGASKRARRLAGPQETQGSAASAWKTESSVTKEIKKLNKHIAARTLHRETRKNEKRKRKRNFENWVREKGKKDIRIFKTRKEKWEGKRENWTSGSKPKNDKQALRPIYTEAKKGCPVGNMLTTDNN